MKITFVVAADMRMASSRYRAVIPAQVLAQLGHEVRLGPPRGDEDVLVFSKHFREEDQRAANKARCRVVYDVCDDHFETQHREHYLKMIAAADQVTCTTSPLRDIIRDETGAEAMVIPDPYEFPEEPPSFRKRKRPRVLWYGHSVNIDTLEPWIDRLDWCDLKVITNKFPSYLVREHVSVEPWSHETMLSGLQRCDLVVLPTLPEKRRKSVKSHNRPLEAIRQGKFVVMGHLPSYEQFDMLWINDDIEAGVKWCVENPDEVVNRVQRAQDFIRSRYSPRVVTEYWLRAFGKEE